MITVQGCRFLIDLNGRGISTQGTNPFRFRDRLRRDILAMGGVEVHTISDGCTHLVVRHSQQQIIQEAGPAVVVVGAGFVVASAGPGRLERPLAVRMDARVQ